MIPTSWLYRILGAAVAAAALLWLIQSRDHWRDEARANDKLYRAEQAAHVATVANYRAAAEQARRADSRNIARVKAEQAQINERTAYDFESRTASARADARRLREQANAAATDPRSGGGTPVPDVRAAAGGIAQAAGENRLPQPEALIATEQAIQLDELIKWVRQQHAVRVDGMSGERPQAVGAQAEGETRQLIECLRCTASRRTKLRCEACSPA
jgi:hypothetical protein